MKDIFKFIFTFSGVENIINKSLDEKKKLGTKLIILSFLLGFGFPAFFYLVMSLAYGTYIGILIVILFFIILYFIIGGINFLVLNSFKQNIFFKESIYYGIIPTLIIIFSHILWFLSIILLRRYIFEYEINTNTFSEIFIEYFIHYFHLSLIIPYIILNFILIKNLTKNYKITIISTFLNSTILFPIIITFVRVGL